MADEEYERYRAEQAAAWLGPVRDAHLKLRAMQAEIEAVREMADGVRSVDYAAAGCGCPKGDAIPNAIAKLQELVEGYCTELAALVDVQADARRRIDGIPSATAREVLARRYLCGRPWGEVEAEMGYTHAGVMTAHRKALSLAYDVMPPNLRCPAHRAL